MKKSKTFFVFFPEGVEIFFPVKLKMGRCILAESMALMPFTPVIVEVLKTIRSLAAPLSQLPMLACSSYNLSQSKRFYEAGFDGFLPRPIHSQKLIKMAARLLSGEKGEIKENNGKKQPIVTQHTLLEEVFEKVKKWAL
jgi:hypothetical protein